MPSPDPEPGDQAEDLTRIDPTRELFPQTLGGAFADDVGAGPPSISIAGHTGWRGDATKDGMRLFSDLRDLVTQYMQRRNAAAITGRDPAQ